MMDVKNFMRAYPPATAPRGIALHLPFSAKGEVGLKEGKLIYSADRPSQHYLYLGTLGKENKETPVIAYEVNSAEVEEEIAPETQSLRALYDTVSETEWVLAGYATQILHFQTISKFCPRCGTATVTGEENTWAKACPNTGCSYTFYPPVSPAVLLLVHDGKDRILLASKEGWGARHSILAGFVEPGETLEGCVAREALEEVGLEVTDIVYRGGQPWPFPHQLMLGFFCRCLDPEKPMTLDTHELASAGWFHRDELPQLPPPLSLSRQLIDAWCAKNFTGTL
jgi:NAD+ diphosphatase